MPPDARLGLDYESALAIVLMTQARPQTTPNEARAALCERTLDEARVCGETMLGDVPAEIMENAMAHKGAGESSWSTRVK